jgi:hypothetical protein
MSLLWIQEPLTISILSEITEERKTIFIDSIYMNDYIIAFNKSKEETIKNCQTLLKYLIQKNIDSPIDIDFREIMQNIKIKCEIVSPWGGNE